MSRKLRFEYPGAIYHVLNRGNYRHWIFESDGAKHSFLKSLSETCDHAGWKLHAYVLMGNHFHLALETPEPNLSEGMRVLQSKFAIRFNRYRKETGRLFQGRFRSIVIEDSERLVWLCHYIHLNPVRAGICPMSELKHYSYGSYWYLRRPSRRPIYLEMETCLKGAGGLKDTPYGRNKYEAYLNWLQEDDAQQKAVNFDKMSKGWVMGTKSFKQGLLKDEKQMGAAIKLGTNEAREARELAWELRLKDCLIFLGSNQKAVRSEAKSVPWKVAIATHLKTRMLCRNGWLGEHLSMGSESGVSRLTSQGASGTRKEVTEILDSLNARFKE